MPSLKKVFKVGVPVLLAAALTAGATIYAQRGNDTRRPGTSNSVSVQHGNGNCINLGGRDLTCNVAASEAADSIRTEDAPAGPGPWAFRVVDTVLAGTDLGLTVRSCPYRNCGCAEPHCEKVGFARHGSMLYAACRLDSGFNGNDTTTRWLKIKWPNNRPADSGAYVSAAQDAFVGWVLEKYTSPAGHNGAVPDCA